MSPRLKKLSGNDVIRILESFDFDIVARRGSHVKLRRAGVEGEKQTLTIPLHSEIDAGTLRAIFRQASRYVPEGHLRECFYTK